MFATKTAEKVLNALTTGLDKAGNHRRIGGKIGGGHAFMPVVVENIGDDCFSVAHYFEMNGDLVQDPDVVVKRTSDGFIPLSIQHPFRPVQTTALLDSEGELKSYYPHELNRLKRFLTNWMHNIADQQGMRVDGWDAEVEEVIQ